MAKILCVEDDAIQAANVKNCLEREGHIIELADRGDVALQLCSNGSFDLLLIDWQLPGCSGLDICREYRKLGGKSWVIFLTGKGELESKETGLDAGADDYMVKPIDFRELIARVRRALQRNDKSFQAELRIGDVVLDPKKRTLVVNEFSVHLMPKESALLEYLMRNPNKPANANKLLSAVWPSEGEFSEASVRTFMASLRKKLIQAGKEGFISSVAGSGYVINTKQD